MKFGSIQSMGASYFTMVYQELGCALSGAREQPVRSLCALYQELYQELRSSLSGTREGSILGRKVIKEIH